MRFRLHSENTGPYCLKMRKPRTVMSPESAKAIGFRNLVGRRVSWLCSVTGRWRSGTIEDAYQKGAFLRVARPNGTGFRRTFVRWDYIAGKSSETIKPKK